MLTSHSNPLLADIRDENGWCLPDEEPKPLPWRIFAMLEYIRDWPADAGTPRVRNHARRVLTRLVNVYGLVDE